MFRPTEKPFSLVPETKPTRVILKAARSSTLSTVPKQNQQLTLLRLLNAAERKDEKEIVQQLKQTLKKPELGTSIDKEDYRQHLRLWVRAACQPEIKEVFQQIRLLQYLIKEFHYQFDDSELRRQLSKATSIGEISACYHLGTEALKNQWIYCDWVKSHERELGVSTSEDEAEALFGPLPQNEANLPQSFKTSLEEGRKYASFHRFYALYDMVQSRKEKNQPFKLYTPFAETKKGKKAIKKSHKTLEFTLATKLMSLIFYCFVDASFGIPAPLLSSFKKLLGQLSEKELCWSFQLGDFSHEMKTTFPTADDPNWFHVIPRLQNNEELVSALLQKFPVNDVFSEGVSAIYDFRANRRETYLKMMIPYFCEIPLDFFERCNRIEPYGKINIRDLIGLETEARRRVNEAVAAVANKSISYVVTTMIAAYYTLIPDKAPEKYYGFFPEARITSTTQNAASVGCLRRP